MHNVSHCLIEIHLQVNVLRSNRKGTNMEITKKMLNMGGSTYIGLRTAVNQLLKASTCSIIILTSLYTHDQRKYRVSITIE